MCFKDSKSRSSRPQPAETKNNKNLSLSVISADLSATLAFSPNGPMARPHEPCSEAMSKPSHYRGAAVTGASPLRGLSLLRGEERGDEPSHSYHLTMPRGIFASEKKKGLTDAFVQKPQISGVPFRSSVTHPEPDSCRITVTRATIQSDKGETKMTVSKFTQ